MMKLKVRETVVLVLSFLMVFAIAANPAYARESNNYENARQENDSLYISYSDDAMQSENLNASDGNVETFNVAGHITLLQNYINYANELLANTFVDVSPGVNTPGNRYWSTQEARDALIAAITAAQIVLDAHGGGIQPGSLTIIPHSSCFNIPVYEAEIELPLVNPYNSNSFANGILRAVGIHAPSPRNRVPGWENPIPPHMFEKGGGSK